MEIKRVTGTGAMVNFTHGHPHSLGPIINWAQDELDQGILPLDEDPRDEASSTMTPPTIVYTDTATTDTPTFISTPTPTSIPTIYTSTLSTTISQTPTTPHSTLAPYTPFAGEAGEEGSLFRVINSTSLTNSTWPVPGINSTDGHGPTRNPQVSLTEFGFNPDKW